MERLERVPASSHRARVRVKRDALEVALVRKNLTKTAFARAARLHRTYLSDILAGRASPGPAARQRMLDVLGGSFDDYFDIMGQGAR
jgi:transcriptional regulator with XRE-family HTH domain